MPAGASCLNRETYKRDNASARLFLTPGTCWARKRILNRKHANTSWRTKIITVTSRDVALLIISTNAALSVKKIIR